MVEGDIGNVQRSGGGRVASWGSGGYNASNRSKEPVLTGSEKSSEGSYWEGEREIDTETELLNRPGLVTSQRFQKRVSHGWNGHK